MEEGKGIGQIIIFVLMVIISIISQIHKSNKKKKRQEESQGTPPPMNHEEDDWWNDSYEMDDKPVPVLTEYSSQPEEYVFKGAESSLENSAVSHNSRSTVREDALRVTKNRESIGFAVESEVDEENILGDFDPQKAIIYHELLKPKFKEY